MQSTSRCTTEYDCAWVPNVVRPELYVAVSWLSLVVAEETERRGIFSSAID